MKELNPQDQFAIEEDRQAARTLYTIILSSVATYFVVSLTGIYAGDGSLVAVTLGGTAVLTVPLWLLRRGHLRASSLILVLCLLATVTIIAMVGQGIHDLAILAYPTIIILLGLTLRGAGFQIGVLLTLAAMGWLVFGEAGGLFVPTPDKYSALANFLVVVAVVLVGAFGVNLLVTSMSRSLERARQEIAQRRRAEEALRETNAYLDNLINHANAPIIVWDPQFHVTRFNHAFENLTGRQEAEILGQSVETLFPPALAELSGALVRKTLTGERWEAVEIKILHREGSERTVLFNSATLFEPDGRTPLATIAQGQDITDRKHLEEELQQQATTDALTGIANRRQFIALATRELERAVRFHRPLTIAMADLDHLKSINDAHGHATGDRALKAFATACQTNIRKVDLPARFGGDEFALLLPETGAGEACRIVERLRQIIAAVPLDAAGGTASLTVSVGVASMAGDQDTLDELLGRADQALYRAKEAGRDRVECARADQLAMAFGAGNQPAPVDRPETSDDPRSP